jgi:hypothetical protein
MKIRSALVVGLSIILACGDVTVSAPTANECLEACRAGEVCVGALCVAAESADAGPASGQGTDAGAPPASDAGAPPASDAGNVVIPVGGDGSSAELAAFSCQELLAAYPQTESEVFFIDPDGPEGPIEPVQLFCGMEYDDGGWTQVARLRYGGEVWDAWSDREGQATSSGSWGVPLSWFSNDDDGRDLEILIGATGTQEGGYYIGPSYSDVPKEAWQPGVNVEQSIGDGFDFRTPGEGFRRCEADIWRRNRLWSWAISRGEDGCSGWAGGGGFVIYGSSRAADRALSVWGLNAFGDNNRGARFDAVELFVRRR